MKAKNAIAGELSRLLKGLVVVVVSGSFLTLTAKFVGIKKLEFVAEIFGVSVWGLIGMLSFVIAWAAVYGKEICQKTAKKL